jgi:hypothetical protein
MSINYLIISHTVDFGENEILSIEDEMKEAGFQNLTLAIRPGFAVDFDDLKTTIELSHNFQNITPIYDPGFDPIKPSHTYLVKYETKKQSFIHNHTEKEGIFMPNYKIGYSPDYDPYLFGVYDASKLGICLNDSETNNIVNCIARNDSLIKLKNVLDITGCNSVNIKYILENYYFPSILEYHKVVYNYEPFNIIIFNCGNQFHDVQRESLTHDILNQRDFMPESNVTAPFNFWSPDLLLNSNVDSTFASTNSLETLPKPTGQRWGVGGKICEKPNYKKKYLKYKIKYLKLSGENLYTK